MLSILKVLTLTSIMTIDLALFSVLLTALFLCWGSFLNVVAYRLLFDIPFFKKRSECPRCHTVIAWYDLLPIVSWLLLNQRCRFCKEPISWLYPLIELLTMISFWGLFLKMPDYFWGYSLFFSALIVTIRTDLEAMAVHRFCTLLMIPCALLLSMVHVLPLTPINSLLGFALGYSILALVRGIHKKITGLIGLGQGDVELLATIGAFLGPAGCWISLLIGSLLGTLFALWWLPANQRHRHTQFPFGPALALGALITTLYQGPLQKILLGL